MAEAIALRPRLALLGVVLTALPAAYFVSQVKMAGSEEALFLAGDPALPALQRFTREFGGNEQIIVGVRGPIFTEAGLAAVDALTHELEALPAVERALSITNVKNIYQGPAEVYAWAPYEWVVDGDKTPEELKAELLQEPLFAGNLVAADGSLAAVAVTLRDSTSEAVAAIRERAAAAEQRTPGLQAVVAGFPVERADFAAAVEDDQRRLVPAVILVIALINAMLFRQVWGVLLTLGVVGYTLLLTLGVAGAVGITLNPVTSLLAPVVMVVSVAVATNVTVAYGQISEPGAAGIAQAYARVGSATFFASVTTALGFGALAATEVAAIEQFGLLCALGVLLSWMAALVLIPAVIGNPWLAGPSRISCRDRPLRRGVRLGQWAGRHPAFIGLGALVAVSVAAWGITRLRVDTDILGQLPQGSPLARATAVLEESLGGVNTVDLLFTSAPGVLRDATGLAAVGRVADAMAQCCGSQVSKTLWVGDILARIHQVKTGQRALPSAAVDITDYLGLLDQAPDSPSALFLNRDGSAARVSVRLAAASAAATSEVLVAARAAAEHLPPGISMVPTGQFVLVQNMTQALPRQQWQGLMWASALIVICIALLLRSVVLAAVAALPASVPVVGVYGLMGALGIPLSVATSMIASVVLGLAVDAAILFLTRYRDARRGGQSTADAEHTMLQSVGQSVLYSNLALVGGFGVAAFSEFPPARDFALLTAVTMGASLMTAWLGVPALMRRLGRLVK